MSQTSRELVQRTLRFQHPERLPRDLWLLPWASLHHPEAVAALQQAFPPDIVTAGYSYPRSARIRGDQYRDGEYTDEWGCVFRSIQDGIIGEVVNPIIRDVRDWRLVQPPYELLPADPSAAYASIREFCDTTDKFVTANCFPRPWERYQFLRGSANALVDLLTMDQGGGRILGIVHDFYRREIEFWAKSAVDGIVFSDDWGAQNRLLIAPELWRAIFKPLYREYCDLAKSHGKFILLHSDGFISDIIGDLIEIGVDAVNSQLFCMDIAELGRRHKGRITFWGEIDRQQVLPSPDPEVGRAAVRRVASQLYDTSGGVIAQFEFGLDANPATALAAFDEWAKWDRAARIVQGAA